MESIESVSTRLGTKLETWLAETCGFDSFSLHPITSDAGFRTYYRLTVGKQSFVVMDAGKAQENLHAFITIANTLRANQITTPTIYFADLQQRYLVLSDFGRHTFLHSVTRQSADQLYRQGLDVLSRIQAVQSVADYQLPAFDANFIRSEWDLHKEWFLKKFLEFDTIPQEDKLDVCYEQLVQVATAQPQVFMHRDYISTNIMVMENALGVLDFQDAFVGPVTYDIASFLRDCYVDWPEAQVVQWALYYKAKLENEYDFSKVSDEEFLRWFDFVSMQRHLKALITFSRKSVRDNDQRYLKFIPRTVNYLIASSKSYKELAPLYQFLVQFVYPSIGRKICAD